MQFDCTAWAISVNRWKVIVGHSFRSIMTSKSPFWVVHESSLGVQSWFSRMPQAKYLRFIGYGFSQENFSKILYFTQIGPMGWHQFLPQRYNLEKLDISPLDKATKYLSSRHMVSNKKVFLSLPYTNLHKIKWPLGRAFHDTSSIIKTNLVMYL